MVSHFLRMDRHTVGIDDIILSIARPREQGRGDGGVVYSRFLCSLVTFSDNTRCNLFHSISRDVCFLSSFSPGSHGDD